MISEESLQKFIALYERKYGIRLERQAAFELFSRLISVVKLGGFHE